jgi:ATP-dependent Zn protease
MTDEGSWQAAYHEAGHMVAAWELGLNVLRATIVPDAEAGYVGRVIVLIEDRVRFADWVESEDAYLYAHMVVSYAGMEAGEKYAGVPLPPMNIDLGFVGPDSDYGQIADVILAIAGSDEQAQLETSERARRQARHLVEVRWSQIETVAETLVNRETLDERECREVLEALL